VGYSVLNPKEYLPRAEAAAQKALQLDETLADAHNAMANLKAYRWDWQGADREFKRALELNPNLAIAHRYYAVFLSFLRRNEEAVNEITGTRELDPLSLETNTTLGFVLCNAGRYDEGIEVLNKTIALEKNHSGTYWFLGYCYPAKHMYKEAIGAFEKAIELGQNTPGTQIRLGAAYAHAGDRARAETILKQLQTSKEYVSPFELAILYLALGKRDQAFESLEKAYNERDLQFRFLNVSYEFDSIRSDSRFQDYVRRVGLNT
jgi:tetratricopeptide (TPR) repeat protein